MHIHLLLSSILLPPKSSWSPLPVTFCVNNDNANNTQFYRVLNMGHESSDISDSKWPGRTNPTFWWCSCLFVLSGHVLKSALFLPVTYPYACFQTDLLENKN